jgi:alkanesulfonate monooxygenase SsuD/methylene tetrahydromethanopterin reductase-like flavin-dependent oxidoreductase (luciferase family)
MRYGFVFPIGEARTAAEFAREAEQAGWDGFFVPDTVWGFDPWVTLTAAAMLTERIRLGTMLTPVSRRRPWKLAGETATLDRLSGGRVILATGLGAIDTGFAEFGEATERRARAELLDEGLAIVDGLWRGQPFNFSGKHYNVRETTFYPPPPPVQQPRIPVWVVGLLGSERSLARVARWDGLLPNKKDARRRIAKITPKDVRGARAWIEQHRTAGTPFDIVMEGETPGDRPKKAAAIAAEWAAAGATWWLESRWSAPNLDVVLKRIKQGPPAPAA